MKVLSHISRNKEELHPRCSSFIQGRKTIAVACLGLMCAFNSFAGDRIINLASGNEITRAALLDKLAKADFVLLGELHDNPHHHSARAGLIEALANKNRISIVAEHLEQKRPLATDGDLQKSLEDAGFNAKSWRWPMHEPLFRQARQSNVPVRGGNIPRSLARDIVKRGETALPADVAQLMTISPLSEQDRKTLENTLLESHCDQLPATLVPGMLLAQRARDAAMALALSETTDNATLLLAGNGHIRRDYGVPTLLKQLAPHKETLTVGFLEVTETAGIQTETLRTQYDFVWITDPAQRDDPCLGFRTSSNR